MKTLVMHASRTALIFGLAAGVILAEDASSASTEKASSDVTNVAAPAPVEGKLSRWLSMDELSVSSRYRNSYNTNGRRVFDNGQERSIVKGKFKFDEEGKYFIGFRVTSGTYFNWSYANFGGVDYGSAIATNRAFYTPQHAAAVAPTRTADPVGRLVLSHLVANGWAMYVRDLYLSASPVSFLTFEYGGIPIERGASSEITSWDEDGYMQGGRVRIKLPKYLLVDQFVTTVGFIGDPTTPNLFKRGERFGETSYRQFLAEKHFGKRLHASVDFTDQIGTHTMREAVRVNTPEAHFVDSARVELYQRMNSLPLPAYVAKSGYGWSASAAKKLYKKYSVEGGYADIDPDYGVYSTSSLLTTGGFPLNGDAWQLGRRFFGKVGIQPTSYLSFFGFYTHEVNPERTPTYFGFNRQSINGGLTIDFKSILSDKMHLF